MEDKYEQKKAKKRRAKKHVKQPKKSSSNVGNYGSGDLVPLPMALFSTELDRAPSFLEYDDDIAFSKQHGISISLKDLPAV